MKIGFIHSLIRKDEKLLIAEFNRRTNVDLVRIDSRQFLGDFDGMNASLEQFDGAIERTIGMTEGRYMAMMLEGYGIPVINSSEVIAICGDKVTTSFRLSQSGISQPQTGIAFSAESAMDLAERMGFPVVIKPIVGSWGRLLAKINDRDALEAIVEHKLRLGNFTHSVIYMQSFIEKGNRDIRAFVVGDQCIAAIYRESEHWVTNTARGGKAFNCPVTDELNDIATRAASSVGGGILAVDLMESQDGLVVTEVNATMEFKNSIKTTGVNIPAHIVSFVLEEARA